MYRENVLQGKVAMITGGASGIGLGIAQYFASLGATVAVCSRNQARLEDAQKAIGGKVVTCVCDVRKPEEVMRTVKFFMQKCGKIDILINCAAGNFLSSLSNMSFNAFRTVMEIDAFGTFNATKCVYEAYMRAHGGVIINITATLHHCGVLLQSHAGAAKAAIDALTKHFAVELGPHRIRVNGVAPGPIEGTEGVARLSAGEGFTNYAEFLPLGRMGKSQEIAEACVFLVLCEYITGHTIVVDGGSTLALGNFPLASPSLRKAWQGKL